MTNELLPLLQTEASSPELLQALKKLNLKLEVFTEPKAFLQRIKAEKPPVCLVDVSLKNAPVMIAMIKGIRSALSQNLPIIVLGNSQDTATFSKALAAGATQCIERSQNNELAATLSKYFTMDTALPAMEVPQFIKWFFKEISPVMTGLHDALQTHDVTEAQINHYAEHLESNRAPFINMINTLRKNETKADLLQCIRMYGPRNTRSLVVATRLTSLMKSEILKWNTKTGLLSVEPARIIQFAVKSAEHFGENSRYEHIAFNSGLVLDLLFLLTESFSDRKSALRKHIQETYDRSIAAIDKCLTSAKSVENLTLEQHIVTTHLMTGAGKIAMAIFFPEYLEVQRKLDRKGAQPELQHIYEMEKFGVSHNILGSLICHGAPGLGAAYAGVLFLDYSFMLRDLPQSKDAYELARVCRLN